MCELELGDKVFFSSEEGQKLAGTVVKLNRKTVSLCTHDGNHWRVSPVLLRRAETKNIEIEVEPIETDPLASIIGQKIEQCQHIIIFQSNKFDLLQSRERSALAHNQKKVPRPD
jgi:hypothetical protein